MSKYVLNHTALRSWWLADRACVTGIGGLERSIIPLSKEEFDLMMNCDGEVEIEDSELVRSLSARRLIRPAKNDERTDPYLLHKSYKNRYVRDMGLNITERCNFNCLHCYEATDNQILRNEMPFEKCESLIRQAAACGIQNVKITGGEPLMHPDFMKIIRCVYENGMTVDRINTNAFFLTDSLLDELRLIDNNILFNVSYDGAGYHDWMRGVKGAEKDILKHISMLTKRDFLVCVAMTLNRVNVGAAAETMRRSESLGAREFRIIRTSETPRWLLNAGDACLPIKEYYDAALQLCREYASSSRPDRKMLLDIWHFCIVFPSTMQYLLAGIRCKPEDYRPDMVLCPTARDNITITPDGCVYPCTPSPGLYKAHGMDFGNVYQTSLKQLLQESNYLSFVCTGAHAISEHDPKCASCRHFRQCQGGCRLFALGLGGNVYGHDPNMCRFFEGNYYEKIRDALPGYACVNEVAKEDGT